MEDVGNQGALQHGVPADSAGAAAQQAQHTPPAQQQHAGEQQQHKHQHKQHHHEAQIERRDAQIQVLQKKLEHYRSWLSSLQGQMQHKDPQVLKNARRLYIGGIPEGAREAELRTFFDSVMDSTGASCGPGSSIITCKISPDKSYAFLEMRSVEEASNAMAFDGVVFKDTNLKIRRPSNYSSSEAIALGPVTPDPTINTDGLPMCKTVVEDTWNKIFIGGLPCHYTDDQVKELLAPYGALKSFNLVMDKNTGKSKGYAFCEFADQRSIPEVIRGLHMHTLERKVLTVKRALEGVRQGGGGSVTDGAGGGGVGRLSAATPLGGTSSGALMHSSSGSSRAGSGMHLPPPPAAAAAMRSGSYSSGSQQQQGGGGGGRYSGRGGSGSPSPMHSTMHGGERRFSPHHPQHSGGMGSPGGGHSGDPFGGAPGGAHPHHMMTHPPGGPHPGGPGFGMGFYMAGEPPGGMFGGPGVMPPPGPLHGWPTHGVFAPTGGARAQRGGFEGGGSGQWSHHQQQQQHHHQQRGGGGGGPSRGSASYPSGGRQHSTAAGGGNGGGHGGGNNSQSPTTPSPVPPTPGSAPDTRPSTLSPCATAGGGGGSGELGAGSSSGGGAVGHRSATGHSSMGSSTRQRPSDAGSSHNPDASH